VATLTGSAEIRAGSNAAVGMGNNTNYLQQVINTGDKIGTIFTDDDGISELHFELWQAQENGTNKLNPELWLAKK